MATTTLAGTTGNDILNAPGLVSADVIGLQGVDTITLARVDDVAHAGQGNDLIQIADTAVALALENTISGGLGNDTVDIQSAVSLNSVIGLDGGDDIFTYTAGAIVGGSYGGNAGEDTIRIAAAATNATVGGGQGNDSLSFTAAAALVNTKIEGGKNADTIRFLAAGVHNISSVQAGQGHDLISLTAVGATFTNGFVGAGKGLDSIELGTGVYASVAGGRGDDTIRFASTAVGSGIIVYGDGLGTTTGSDVDGDDFITLSAATTSIGPISVYGGGGADTVGFTTGIAENASAVLIDGGINADFIGNTAVTFTGGGDVTLQGGSGHDTVKFYMSTTTAQVLGGNGSDSIFIGATGVALSATNANVSVNGGAGNDTIDMNGFDGTTANALGGGITINGGAGVDSIRLGTWTAATAGSSSCHNLGNVVYEAGDLVTFENSNGAFAATSLWVGSTQIYIMTAAAAFSAVNVAQNSAAGNISVFNNGGDLQIGISENDSSTSIINVIGGGAQILATGTGNTTASSSNFSFSLATVGTGQLQITFG